jgi:hypothetical protein
MFDVGSGSMLYMFTMEPHRAMAILATEFGNAVADRIRHRDPFPPFFVTAFEQLLYLAVVNPLGGF